MSPHVNDPLRARALLAIAQARDLKTTADSLLRTIAEHVAAERAAVEKLITLADELMARINCNQTTTTSTPAAAKASTSSG